MGSLGFFLSAWDELRVRGVSKRTSYEFSSSLVCKCVSAHYTRTVGHKLLLSDFLICCFSFFSVYGPVTREGWLKRTYTLKYYWGVENS